MSLSGTESAGRLTDWSLERAVELLSGAHVTRLLFPVFNQFCVTASDVDFDDAALCCTLIFFACHVKKLLPTRSITRVMIPGKRHYCWVFQMYVWHSEQRGQSAICFHYNGEKTHISPAAGSKTWQLASKQPRWIKSAGFGKMLYVFLMLEIKQLLKYPVCVCHPQPSGDGCRVAAE